MIPPWFDHRANRILLIIAILTLPGTSRARAEAKRDWHEGTWRDAHQTILQVRADLVSGTIVGACVISPEGSLSLGAQLCAIETADAFYFVRRRLNASGTNAVPVTADSPARFAIEKNTLYAVGSDGKEYKFDLARRIPKPAVQRWD